jgi:hypothetical protein
MGFSMNPFPKIKPDNQNRKRCPHCSSRETLVDCVSCNREMCEGCISFGDVGKVCGLCYDREQVKKRYEKYADTYQGSPPLKFDEWYDING